MVYMPSVTVLKKIGFPYISSNQLHITPWLNVGLCAQLTKTCTGAGYLVTVSLGSYLHKCCYISKMIFT